MFDLITESLERPLRRRSPAARVISVVGHAVILSVLVVLPLLFAADVVPPVPPVMMAFVTAPPPAPPPPPPPPAPAPRTATRAAERPVQKSHEFAAPIEAPREIREEPAVPAAQALGGVEGGVEGGVPGGIAGGIVGGIVSARPRRRLHLPLRSRGRPFDLAAKSQHHSCCGEWSPSTANRSCCARGRTGDHRGGRRRGGMRGVD